MSRPLRLEFSDAWYHVMNRGVERKNIFNEPSHFQLFYDLMAQATEKFGIEINAFCLMNNHYHLLIKTPESNLSNAIRHINGIYAQTYNKLLKRDGPLFRGRYKSILVEADSYLLELSRYIHLNPVKANIVLTPEDYMWSSYRFYLNTEHRPKWLYCNEVLNRFYGTDSIKAYAKFVNSSIDSKVDDFYKGQKLIPILGTEEFIQKINKEYISDIREPLPESKAISKKCLPSVEQIIIAVAKYYDIDLTQIKRNLTKTMKNEARSFAIHLAFKYSGKNRREISKSFEGISYLSISSTSRNIAAKLRDDAKLTRDLENIKKDLLLC